MVDVAPMPKRKRPSTAGSAATRDSRLSWGSSLFQKSNNPLSSMASSSLNALRRTRSRNDQPPAASSSTSNSADKVANPPLVSTSRSNSWTSSLGRRSSTKSSSVTHTNPTDSPTSTSPSNPGAGIDPPTPPSESSSGRSSTSSHDTVTPPASAQQQQQQQQQQGSGTRVLSTLATLASPSTYYKPAARLFRPSSSGGSTSSRPSTAGSVKLSPFPSLQPPPPAPAPAPPAPAAPTGDMSGFTRSTDLSTEELHRHADQLILAGLQRTKEATALTRTESNASTSSQSRPEQHHHTHSNSSSSSHLQHSASAPAVGVPLAPTPSRTSWFGFGYASKEEKRAAKEEKRGRKSRPTSETFTSPITGISSRPTSASGARPSTATGVISNSGTNTPLAGAASPQVAPLQVKIGGSNNGNFTTPGGQSLPSAPPIMTIREGVPLTHSLTVDSVMTTASEADGGRRGRQRARSSSPFRAFRSSRSRGGTTAKEEKEKEKKREKSSGRSPSPAIHALKRSESDAESDAESLGWGMRRKKKGVKVRRTAFDQRSNNGGETEDEAGEDDDDEEDWSEDEEDVEDEDDGFDPETTQNTEANATPMDPEVCLSIEGHHFPGYDDDIELPDPLGEGVNVVRPEAPMFAQTLMAHNRPSVNTTSPARARAASPRSVNTGGSGGDDADSSGRRRSTSVDGQTIGAVASSPTSSSMSPTTSTSTTHTALTPAQVAARTPKKKKTMKSIHSTLLDPLPLNVSRPHFTRDRCTVVLKHGNARERSSSNATAHPVIPEGSVVDELGNVDGPREVGGGYQREPKRYVVFSDMSEESKWAVEWGIGTVLRDGDEMILVTVQETESKLDPAEGATVDRLQKLRNQQERQALASLLVRQATSLLQRTKLNVIVTCQAMHAKNARRLFLDIIDLLEPTMVIVGSRGLGKLKGILLGSTSHYLIQKSSVPVMVARRRLKRPTRKSHTAAQAIAIRSEKRVSLADARIEKMSSGQGKGATGVDVEDIQREHEQAEKEWPRIPGEDEEVVVEEEEEEEEDGATGSGAQEQETPQSPSTSSRADSPSAEKRAPGVSGKVAGV